MDIHKKSISKLFIFFLFFNLLSCTTQREARVPVHDIWRQPLKVTTTYVVQPGDTLYSIAWAYGLDYRQVAAANGINSPAYHIEVGKKLILTANNNHNNVQASAPVAPIKKSIQQQAKPVAIQPIKPAPQQQLAKPSATTIIAPQQTQQTTTSVKKPQFMAVQTVQHDGIAWAWPAQGKVVCAFSSNNLAKGIDIAGKNGAPVLAAASGKVVYASNGLRGYGLLVIIKHNDEYLSAYAHNQKLLVTEGQTVREGQVIARMGSTEARRVMLHFEIRQAGKPVDPLQYLPRR